jgi:hypothetical protein
MRPFELMRVSYILDRVFVGVVASGIGMTMIWLMFAVSHANVVPFPTFGADDRIDEIWQRLILCFLVFWVIWAISYGRRAVRLDWPNPTPGIFLSLLAVLVGAAAWYPAIPMLNALLDFSPKVVTPVYIRRSTGYETAHGTKLVTRSAKVSRPDHPDEEVKVRWEGCTTPAGILPRIAKIKLGRGAFGVPWFSVAVQCHALAVDSQPLFDDFYLGKGRAAVLVALRSAPVPKGDDPYVRAKRDLFAGLTRLAEGRTKSPSFSELYAVDVDAMSVMTDDEQKELKRILRPLPGAREEEMAIGRQALTYATRTLFKRDSARQLEHWTRAIEARFPDVPVVVLAEPAPLDPEHRASCPRCRETLKKALDSGILQVFMEGKDPWDGGDHVYLANAAGRKAFEAALPDVDQEPRLLDKLAVSR